FAQAFFVIHFFGRKTEYAGTPLTLTESTAQRRTDTHENNNSAPDIASLDIWLECSYLIR
ncbi:hypothetical protein, partial [Bifidobacterium felsineum]|uniref:hypothetical protein n=1 Tax=Bifidobacterium felsineum TaxID=2045440 RepID=UPI001BDD1829